ncbi:toll/interleukin-1 receptor domain-containing protein [Acinetobacter venetianus]|uniref:toll/interleukin-1 receptor domain-containing protein n=1 Tax=Acinetobacter venetianus TaxID=52133 RepID=UPI00037915BA|nr:toll/interleukin-1 receptor domain-containing protein [Acinetobacter venetianus]
MPHKIFLSHNHNDKPLVEAVALRLANIFGQDQIFYDSWSILPGDGIIDQMNKGLETPEFIFFFVSAQSLKSDMVKLEWQNALYAATKGKTRLIPIRVDGCNMPTLLQQTLYIDMYSIGLEATIAQIVSLTQGNASFTPQF